MIERSFNPEDLYNATTEHRDLIPEDFDFKGWVGNELNVLVKDGDSIGFITYEYPGCYSAHHFHKVGGRAAINSSTEMMKFGFDNFPMKIIRGMTKTKLRAACWIARQLGMKSYGIFETKDEPYELFCITAEEFYDHYNKRNK